MKQIIEEILEGNFKSDNGSLDFSCTRIELSLQTGEIAEGSFTVYGPEGTVTEGYVVSSDLRVECLTTAFGGSQDEILYRVDASVMEPGEQVKGAFHIVSNQGEYYLPFSVAVVKGDITSSLGNVKNLFHFTNLAKSSWAEAVKLFYSKEFEQVFAGNDRQHYTAYKGLSTVYGNEHNVEEFLLEINKKKPVEYIPEETQITIEDPAALSRYTLVINRNGWGYTHLQIETEGGFLTVNENEVSDDEFLGNLYRLYYYIQDNELHTGINYGCIRLISYERRIEIPVTVVLHTPEGRRLAGLRREKKRAIVQMMQFYQSFRLKKISTRIWLDETGKLIERLKETDGDDVASRLFQAQLLLTKECFREAEYILEQNREEAARQREEKPQLWCYYLYLTALCSKSDSYVDEITERITRIFDEDHSNWRIAWLLFFLSDIYTKSATRKWALLEELFSYHAYSPLLYIEAWNLLCMNPAMLLRLGEFELQVLNYAAKQEAVKDDVIIQLLYLVQKQKGYSEILLRILISCYNTRPQNDILHAICSTLIKGNKCGAQYFAWYKAGVEQNLRITRLYEYYMMSVPLDGKETLPKMVLMYFSYQNDLHYEIAAYLYAYVLKNQEAMPDIYVNYIPLIEQFVIEQIKKGRINKNLAYLYRNVAVSSMMDEESAKQLMKLLFLKEITVDSDEVRQVILVYPYGKKQMAYPVSGRHAQIPVYDDACKVILEDGGRNRYSCSIPYHMEELITTGKLFAMAAPFTREDLGYAVHVCYDHKSILQIQEENVEQFKLLAASDFLEEPEQKVIRMKLVQFYFDRDRMWELDEYLFALKPDMTAAGDRKKIIQIMVSRGMYPEAYGWIRHTGPYGIDVKTLVRLCSRLLGQGEWDDDPLMMGILVYVTRKGKYDENILRYLIRYFNGSVKEMRDIWRAANDFGVETYELSERIIIQMLYTGAYIGEKMDIFQSYRKDGGREKVIAAFLSQCCYDYVIKEKVTDNSLIRNILQMYREKMELHLVCKLACLKYYAENPEESEGQVREVILVFLEELLKQHIVLPLFKAFQGYLPALDMLQDKTLLEYRAKPGHRAVIHYLIQQGEGKEQEYLSETMKDMFSGICVKDFVLFFGERLQYYITEETDGTEQVTQSGTVSKSDMGSTAHIGSRFDMLNDIMIGRNLQDYDTVDKLLEEYYKKDYMVDKLFTIR